MHNFYGVRNKVNNFRKGFVFDAYDQPTYLTFALDFRFENLDANQDVSRSSPLFVDGSPDTPMSAQTYLGSIGHKDKEANLKRFKQILEYLTFNAPWYFQSIQGLDKLWSGSTDVVGGWKAKEAVLTINTLEAIDLRLTEIANLYRSSIYDKVQMRERVPDNLRWFQVDIYIAEARNIRYTPPGITGGIISAATGALGLGTVGATNLFTQASAGLSNILQNSDLDKSNPLEQFGFVKFKCSQCEFDFSDSLASHSNDYSVDTSKSNAPATNKFKIKVGYFEEESEHADGVKIADDFTTNELKNPWSKINTSANIQNRLNGAGQLPIVGDLANSAGGYLKEKLRMVGGLINPALGAAFNGIPVKNLGDLYEGNNPSPPPTKRLDPKIYPDRFPDNSGSRNLGSIY
jgi:hypothetical protein